MASDDEHLGEPMVDPDQFVRSSMQIMMGKSVDPLLKREQYLQGKAFYSVSRLKGSMTSAAAAKAAAIPRKKGIKRKAEKHEIAKIKRVMTYEQTVEEVSRWDTVVKENRSAEQLSFPRQQADLGLKGTTEITKRFSNRTSLEQQVAAALGKEGYLDNNNKKQILSRGEERIQRAVNLKEAQERRAQLRKNRLLQSFREAEWRRQKKIKSKRYHRILKKDKIRKEKTALEKMEQEDPEGYSMLRERADKRRMEERMSLKHRGGSKFARERVQYKKFDVDTRNALSTMHDKSRELTKKTGTRISDASETEESETDEDLADDGDVDRKMSASNPWMSAKSDHNKKPAQSLQPVSNKNTEGSSDSDSDESEEESDASDDDQALKKFLQSNNAKNKQAAKSNEMDDLSSNEMDDLSSDSEDEEETEGVQEIVKRSMDEIFSDAEKIKELQKTQYAKRITEKIGSKNRNAKSSTKQGTKTKAKTEKQIEAADSGEEELVEDSDRLQTLEEIEDWSKQEAQKEPDTAQTKTGQQSTNAKATKMEKKMEIDPKNVLSLKMATIQHGHDSEVVVDEGESEKRLTIAQAFADDDVVAEFADQKKSIVDRDKPKDIDLTLPGWGSWGGTNLKPSKRIRKKFLIKAKPAPPRKDRNLDKVIISECADKTINKYQVSSLPFPYGRVSQFESTIRAPIGKTWNPEIAFKKLITPKVVTKLGTIVEPMQESELLARKGSKESKQKRKDGKNGPKHKRKF